MIIITYVRANPPPPTLPQTYTDKYPGSKQATHVTHIHSAVCESKTDLDSKHPTNYNIKYIWM